ncbi:VTT domain-containing protein [bacterium]|nr:VTT domain-containing protein [bacterium]
MTDEADSTTTTEDQSAGRPRKPLKTLVLLCVIGMLVPILPFAIAGPYLESQLERLIGQLTTPAVVLTAAFFALASDIFLPVPSSAIITYAGVKTGFLSAWLVTAAGLTAGCTVGYELSRQFGSLLLKRLATPGDITRLQERARKGGGLVVVLTRPLPILGETAVLIVGCLGMPRQIFYTAAVASNLTVAAVYVQFGRMSREQDSLILPLAISLIAPLLLTFVVRKVLQKRERADNSSATSSRD